jgi:hypothetical protein
MNGACDGKCYVHSMSPKGAISILQCYCKEGYYFQRGPNPDPDLFYVGASCEKCDTGYVCPGGLVKEKQTSLENDRLFTNVTYNDHVLPYAEPGYFAIRWKGSLGENKFVILPCFVPSACLGGIENGCSETMQGLLCDECKTGYTRPNLNGECLQCPSYAANAFIMFCIVMSSLATCIVMGKMTMEAGFTKASIHSLVLKFGSTFMGSLSIASQFKTSKILLPEWTKLIIRTHSLSSSDDPTALFSFDCLLRIDGTNFKYSEVFFYAMAFFFLQPLAWPLCLTFMGMVILIANW